LGWVNIAKAFQLAHIWAPKCGQVGKPSRCLPIPPQSHALGATYVYLRGGAATSWYSPSERARESFTLISRFDEGGTGTGTNTGTRQSAICLKCNTHGLPRRLTCLVLPDGSAPKRQASPKLQKTIVVQRSHNPTYQECHSLGSPWSSVES
jgi:hypothetical protein